MKTNLFDRLIANNHIRDGVKRAGPVLGLAAALVVVVSLMLPAITMTSKVRVLECAYQVHRHTKDCYTTADGMETLVCGYADYVIHVHNDDCYDQDGQLVCQLPEIEPHTHTDACYTEEQELTCGLEESEGHVHNEDCYDQEGNLICGKEEGEGGHTHTAECYQTVKVLTCGQLELHTHTKSCYDKKGNLICGLLQLEEHRHTKECLKEIEITDPEDEAAAALSDAPESARADTEDADASVTAATVDERDDAGSSEVPATAEEPDSSDASGTEMLSPASEQNTADDADAAAADTSAAPDPNTEPDTTADASAESAADKGKQVFTTLDEPDSPVSTADPVPNETDEDSAPVNVIFSMPPQAFREKTKRVTVNAVAEEGTFPSGTTMAVRDISDKKTLQNISNSVDGEVKLIQAVDITFLDAEGREIEPQKPIQVTIHSNVIAKMEAPVVVHVEDSGQTSVLDQIDAEELAEAPGAAEVVFTAENFSVYAVVERVIETSVMTADGKTYQITVTCDQSAAVPEDAELKVEEILQASAHDQYVVRTEDALGWASGSVSYARFFDISIVSGGHKVTVAAPVDVKIKLLDKEDSVDTQVVHFGTETEIVNASVQGDTVSFETSGFSVYAIVDGAATSPETKSIRYEFYLADGTTPFQFNNENGTKTNVQYVANGETLLYPGTPTGEQAVDDKAFWGWYPATAGADGTLDWGKEVVFDTPITVTETKTVKLYARYETTYYVTYRDENNDVYMVVKHAKGDQIPLWETETETRYTARDANKAFLGWSETQGETQEVAAGTSYTVTQDVDLYPVIDSVYWINFVGGETGSGASYTAPVYVLGHKVPKEKKPENPSRTGYRFVAWYRDPQYQTEFQWNGREPIDSDLILYAKWEEGETFYTVVFRKESVADTVEMKESGNQTYEYETSFTVPARTGSTVKLTDALSGGKITYNKKTIGHTQMGDRKVSINGKTFDYTGFEYAKADASATVLADGSTVLNVYYDRKTISITFDYPDADTTTAWKYSHFEKEGFYTYYYFTRAAFKKENMPADVTYRGLYGTPLTFDWPTELTHTLQTGRSRYNNASYIDSIIREEPAASVTWQYSKGSTTTGLSFIGSFILPDPTQSELTLTPTISGTIPIRFYQQDLMGDWSSSPTFSINMNSGKFSITDKYNGFTAYQYSTDGIHWMSVGTRSADGVYGDPIENYSQLHIRFTRNKYTLSFRDSKNVSRTLLDSQEVYYDKALEEVSINRPEPPEGYEFHGWYTDETCSTRVIFTEEPMVEDLKAMRYDDSSGRKKYKEDGPKTEAFLSLKNMPDHNVVLYACWKPREYQVNIDPNGGELVYAPSSENANPQSTYFNVDYGETIGEYKNVTRSYIKITPGQDISGMKRYRYHYVTRDHNPEDRPRVAQYIEDDAGEYISDPTAYTFVGWYRVANNGAGEMDRAPFNFSTEIRENTTLRAVWRRAGTFKVKYRTTMNQDKDGALTSPDAIEFQQQAENGANPLEDVYTYVDLAEAKVRPAIAPPEGYDFSGWRVVGTDAPVYQPGQVFPIDSNLAQYEDSIMYITLEPVFTRLGESEILYELNPPVNATILQNQLTDTPDNVQKKLRDRGEVTLSSGSGFSLEGYRFVGWSDLQETPGTPIKGTLYQPSGKYGVSEHVNTLYAVWELVTTEITFTKQGEVSTEDLPAALEGATFGLFADADCTESIDKLFPSAQCCATSDETGTVTFQVPVGTYYLKELSAPANYDLDAAIHTISVTSSSSVAGGESLTWQIDKKNDPLIVTNFLHGNDFTLIKVDSETNAPIQGAEFAILKQITGLESGNGVNYRTKLIIDNENGLKVNLPDGDYILRETHTPPGYNFQYNNARIRIVSGVATLSSADPDCTVSEDGRCIYILNHPGYELPSTGGSGTRTYLVTGLAIISGALVLLGLRRRGSTAK